MLTPSIFSSATYSTAAGTVPDSASPLRTRSSQALSSFSS